MKVIDFDLQAWGTRLKNERNRTNATLELWAAPVSFSRNGRYVATSFEEISPEAGWTKVTESISFSEKSGSGLDNGEVKVGAATMQAYSEIKPHFYFKVSDNYDKFAVRVVDCNFCRNMKKEIVWSGSLLGGDNFSHRESYPFSSSNWMND